MAMACQDANWKLTQLPLVEDFFAFWSPEIEAEVRRVAPMKARECRFPVHEHQEFVSFCIERLSERAKGKNKGVQTVAGVPRAIENLSKDWARRKTRKKNREHEQVENHEYAAVISHGEEIDRRIILESVFDSFPFLSVVSAARTAGIPDAQIAKAFDMSVKVLKRRVVVESAEAASLL